MFVVDTSGYHLLLVVVLVLLFEDINEKTVILLQDGVLGGKLEGHATVDRVVEARLGKGADRGVSVEHTKVATSIRGGLEFVDELSDFLVAIFGGENKLELTFLVDNIVLAAVLITVGVTANDNRLGPAGHEAGDVLDNNGLTEDSAVEDVTDGTVGASPHLLEAELFDAISIGGNGSTLDTDLGALHSFSAINGNLIVGLITLLNGKIVVLSFEVKVGVDVLILDPLPDDASHLITIHIDDGLSDVHLLEGSTEVTLSSC